MSRLWTLLVPFLIVACSQTNEAVDQDTTVVLAVQNLPRLSDGHYQLWGTFFQFNKTSGTNSPEHEGEYVSFGEFNVADDGTVESPEGGRPVFVLPRDVDPQLLKDVVIAIQSGHDTTTQEHAEPGSIVMGGLFHGDAAMAVADLRISYADAFNANLEGSTGKCTITCATSPADSNHGIWFAEASSIPTAGLRGFPMLPSAWRYEGWVVDRQMPASAKFYSTGKFMKPDSADYDGAGPFSDSTRTGFNFPGQDFVRAPMRLDLASSARFYFMITIEPYPDNSISPSFLRLLSTETLTIPPQGRTMNMQNLISSSAPRGQVVINR